MDDALPPNLVAHTHMNILYSHIRFMAVMTRVIRQMGFTCKSLIFIKMSYSGKGTEASEDHILTPFVVVQKENFESEKSLKQISGSR